MMKTKTYIVPGLVTLPGKRKPVEAELRLEAEDRKHALWQGHHGVIEMGVHRRFPGAKVKYDLRKLKQKPTG